MMLITKVEMTKLLANGTKSKTKSVDHKPVIKLFTPDANATWLISEIDPDDPDRAFGLCDLGLGSPELGYVSLSEIKSIRGRMRLPVERDRWFNADKTLTQYAEIARANQRIVA